MHSRSSEHSDTIVIGAGAAGLSAAAELVRQGQRVCIVEARERAGGRIHTLHGASIAVPIELGAEFVHGRSPSVLQELARSGDVAIDATGTRWMAQGGRLREAERAYPAMRRQLQAIRKPSADLPFADFLDRHRRVLKPAVRAYATRLVEGFDAADAHRVSARETLQAWAGSGSADAPTFRPHRGYGALVGSLMERLEAERSAVYLNTVVSEVRWRRGHVQVIANRDGEPHEFIARRAVVTLPIGVEQLLPPAKGAVQFTPELKQRQRALSKLASGSVVKLVMHFDRSFWEQRESGRFQDAAFFLASGAPFPTFWTTLPMRTSILTAWIGGSKAAQLKGRSTAELVRLATASLTHVFGRATYSKMLQSVYHHDWLQDPFANGAYSYACVGGGAARRALFRPIDDTLFFAGEAVDPDEAASVGGAINTGMLAARRILRG